MTTPAEKAREWLLKRFPEYQKDDSVMHVDVEVFMAGYLQAMEEAANVVWANRWEPPYTVENGIVEQIRALANEPKERG
jgi:hypothetical protein